MNKANLEIDRTSLDDELMRQPSLFYEIGEQFVMAASKRDALKEELATIDAELDGIGRATLEKRLEKVTEAMVKNYVQTHKRHASAFASYIQAKTECDLLQAMKEAFSQRSFMLRDLCSLYVANYFGETSYKSTQATEATHYSATRERLAAARTAKRERLGG